MANCPKCGLVVTSVTLEPIAIGPADIPTGLWNGVAYSCRNCFTILSVGPDPAAVQDDTVSLISQKIAESENRLLATLQRILNRRAKS
jgi:hypothetical protein